MIKKLDILILRAFTGPFIATFFITLFILVMQFFWLYLDDFVGKGLDTVIIFRLIGYLTATLVPLALPLAVLLSSIMTFGNLGESFELVAIKSSGIGLLRFMRPLIVFSAVVCGIAFLFNNYIIPVANLKLNTLKYDIIVSKPAFDLKEGVFYDKIQGYVIKIGKKDADNKTIRNIVVYEQNFALQDNIIVAESGTMTLSEDKRFLEFNMKNGWRYQERGNRLTKNTEYIRLGFKEYKKLFDLGTLGKIQKTNDSAFRDNYKMLSIRQLNKVIDSLSNLQPYFQKKATQEVTPYLRFAKLLDTAWVNTDTAKNTAITSITQIIPDSAKSHVLDMAITQSATVKNYVDINYNDYSAKRKDRRLHQIEWHRKFSLSIACLVLLLIGAPLGSIIRKGGLGMPTVAALFFFIIFHLLNTFGEKFVKEGIMNPFMGMWLSSLVLLPIGFFLTYKAMHDSQLFNKEFYYRTFKRILPLLQKLPRPWKKKNMVPVPPK